VFSSGGGVIATTTAVFIKYRHTRGPWAGFGIRLAERLKARFVRALYRGEGGYEFPVPSLPKPHDGLGSDHTPEAEPDPAPGAPDTEEENQSPTGKIGAGVHTAWLIPVLPSARSANPGG